MRVKIKEFSIFFQVNPISVEFVSMLTYQSCMLMQLFLYCWFGNEILLKVIMRNERFSFVSKFITDEFPQRARKVIDNICIKAVVCFKIKPYKMYICKLAVL